MKNLRKDDIKNRFNRSKIDIKVEDERIKPFKDRNITFDRKLTIIIPGEPMVDSRPRGKSNIEKGTVSFYNPHLSALKKIFKPIYESSEILQKIHIISPMSIELRAFASTTKVFYKSLNNKEQKMIDDEKFASILYPDVDNFQKVHYDMLQDMDYQIFHDDQNITTALTTKTLVKDDTRSRMEIYIYYCSKPPKWFTDRVHNSAEYFKYTLSMKYRYTYNIEDWVRHFFTEISKYIKANPKKKLKDIDTTIKVVLNKYSKEELDLIQSGMKREDTIESIRNIVESIYNKLHSK